MLPFVQVGGLIVSGYWLMTVLGLAVAIAYLVLVNRSGRLEFIPWRNMTDPCCITMISILQAANCSAYWGAFPSFF